jgi:hypothetical protein
VKALQATTLLFAVCAAMSIALFTNYIRGLRDTYLAKMSEIRNLLEKFFDEHNDSRDPDIESLINEFVIPLLGSNTDEWFQFEKINEIRKTIVTPVARLHKKKNWFLARYLLRFEDEINELGLLHIRCVVTELHIKNISGTFFLIAFGMSVLGMSYLFPNSPRGNFIVMALSASVVIFAVLEVLLILSYFKQEARDEFPSVDVGDSNEQPISNDGNE